MVGDIEVEGRQLTPHEISEIHEKHIRVVGKGEAARRQSDSVAIGEETFCKMIKSWSGAKDIDGNNFLCTEKNKILVYTYDQEFVANVTNAITEAVRAYKEEETKN